MFKISFEPIRSLFQNWNVFEKVWLLSFIVMGCVITLVQHDTGFNFIVLLSGILCVVLAAKGNILNYSFGLFNSCAYAWICYNNGLYGEMGLNLFFFVPTAIIGIILWKKHTSAKQLQNARTISISKLILIILANISAIILLGYALAQIPTQNTPYIDATTNILSITATVLMMLRFKEQWWFYISLNMFTILMWAIRTIDGSGDGIMMLVMWSAFLINAIYGYYNWNKLAKNSSNVAIQQ